MIRIAAASILSSSPMCLCYKDSNKIESPTLDKNIEFYKKHLNCKGIDIHGSEAVSDTAFNIACERLLRMTRHANYHVHNNLIKNKVDFRLIGLNESMTDLPEHSHMKNKKNGYSGNDISVDKCRGMRHGSSVFCSEENLIQQGNKSKYSPNTKDIFIHETAHAIMDDGLDDITKKEILDAWLYALNKNKWKNDNKKAYALTNPGEYFAELSMWYFGGHGDFIDKNNKFPKPGPGGLAQHDNNGFKLLSKIYGGGSNIKPSNLDNINSNNICPIIDSGIYCVKSDTGPDKHNKVSLLFKLENDDNNADYLVNWVNYKGQIKWGFKINKCCKEFKTNSFTGHAWLVQKAVMVPRFYFFGKKVKKYYRFKAFIANKSGGTCLI